jgi:signal recognition particle receptor subunit beta
MWEILAKDANGFILLLDSSDPTRWPELFRQALLFRRLNPHCPIIIAANKQDKPNAMGVKEIRKKLNNLGGYEIVPVIAQDYHSALNLLRTMRQRIDQNDYCEVEEESA